MRYKKIEERVLARQKAERWNSSHAIWLTVMYLLMGILGDPKFIGVGVFGFFATMIIGGAALAKADSLLPMVLLNWFFTFVFVGGLMQVVMA